MTVRHIVARSTRVSSPPSYSAPDRGHSQTPGSAGRSTRRTPALPTHPIRRAGTPATRAKSGTSRVTTEPAATRAQRPTWTGATHTDRAPSEAPSATVTATASQSPPRRANAAHLDARITGAVVPPVADGARHVYHQYTVRVRGDRDAAMRRLTEAGVGNAVYYPTPVHRLRPYWEPDQKAGRGWDLPETERAAAEVVSLPVHPSLTRDDLERVAAAVNELGGAL
jgi:hypothetical protein